MNDPQVTIWEPLQQDVAHNAIVVARPVKEVDNEADVAGACLPT